MNNETKINTVNENNNLPAENNVAFTQETLQPVTNNTAQEQVQPNNIQNNVPTQTNVQVQNTQPVVQNNMSTPNQEAQIQNQLQSIPTVDQTKEQFINNVQSINQGQKEEKKETNSLILIGILFVVILISIYFLFPLIDKYI